MDISRDGRAFTFLEQGESAGGAVSYLRKMDGSPAVRLSDGACGALSSDGGRVLCVGTDHQLHEVPTRTGEARALTHDHLFHVGARWLPGEKQFVFTAQEGDGGQRVYLQNVDGGDARPITPEGTQSYFSLSQDGHWLAVSMGADYRAYIVPTTGGEPKLIPDSEPACLPLSWSADNHFLYCARMGDVPMNLFQVDMATGRSTPWKQLMPPDPVGVAYVSDIYFSPDLKSYVYSAQRRLDVLYLVEGLH